jgi:hypothetical protein
VQGQGQHRLVRGPAGAGPRWRAVAVRGSNTTRVPVADGGLQYRAPHLLWRAFPILTVLFLGVAIKAADPVVWIVIHFTTTH